MLPHQVEEWETIKAGAWILFWASFHLAITVVIWAGCILLPMQSLAWLPVVIPVFFLNVAQWCVIAGRQMAS